jgi:hypothetical protein
MWMVRPIYDERGFVALPILSQDNTGLLDPAKKGMQ